MPSAATRLLLKVARSRSGPTYDQVMRSLGWLMYLPMTEASGNALDASGNGYNGVWGGTPQRQNVDGPSLGMGKAPAFSGDDVLNFYSTGVGGIDTAWNPAEFTVSFWIRPNGGTGRFFSIRTDPVDNNNRVLIYFSGATTIQFFYAAGGTVKSIDATGLSTSGVWYNGTLTVSKSSDAMKAYINGTQVGSTQTGLGTWVGTPHANCMCIGAQDTSLSSPVSSVLYRCGLANGAAALAAVQKIATVI